MLRKTGQAKMASDGMEYTGRNSAVQDRREGKIAQGRYSDTTMQGRKGKEQEVRQSMNSENRMYAQYRKTKAEKEATVKKKPPGICGCCFRGGSDRIR